MFEEDAKEFADKYNIMNKDLSPKSPRHIVLEVFKNGAEFGYNKANEWHYVNWKYFADKDYPKSESASYLVQQRNKDTVICEWETEEGFGCFWNSNLEPIDNDDVYAWKEIILPELEEIKEKDK